MLFGELSSEAEAHQLLGACLDAGVNFFDSAEMYPVPQRAETQGLSELFLGRWLKQQRRWGAPAAAAGQGGRVARGVHVALLPLPLRREDVVLATKVAGPSGQMAWIRAGPPCLDEANISAAIDGSLRRLGTDYIDLYQVHWPDRRAPKGSSCRRRLICWLGLLLQGLQGLGSTASEAAKADHARSSRRLLPAACCLLLLQVRAHVWRHRL
jgi:hypothetical protein